MTEETTAKKEPSQLQLETEFIEELLDSSIADLNEISAFNGRITYENHEADPPVKVTLTIEVSPLDPEGDPGVEGDE